MTGLAPTQARRRRTQWARPRSLAACGAAGTGAIRLLACVPPSGAGVFRLTGSTPSASDLPAPLLKAKLAPQNFYPLKKAKSDKDRRKK